MKTKVLNSLFTAITISLFSLLTGCGGVDSSSQNGGVGTSAQNVNETIAPQQTGKIAVVLDWGSSSKSAVKTVASMPVTVTTMRIFVAAPDISPSLQLDFPAASGSGTIDGVKVGTGRTLTAQGLDASGTVTYQGAADNITILAGKTTDIGTITMVANAVPTANAGVAQSVTVGSLVTLDGSASSDANSDALTYKWAFTSKPTGSGATLSSTTIAKPAFTADIAGTYVLSLIVNDGKVDSSAAGVNVTVTVANAAPVANVGPVQSVVIGNAVTLDGSASSDANGDTLTYSWSFTSKPVGSSATLSSSTAVKPTFTPDVAGAYVLSLTVNDGKVSSSAASVNVTAISNTGSITIKW